MQHGAIPTPQQGLAAALQPPEHSGILLVLPRLIFRASIRYNPAASPAGALLRTPLPHPSSAWNKREGLWGRNRHVGPVAFVVSGVPCVTLTWMCT